MRMRCRRDDSNISAFYRPCGKMTAVLFYARASSMPPRLYVYVVADVEMVTLRCDELMAAPVTVKRRAPTLRATGGHSRMPMPMFMMRPDARGDVASRCRCHIR